MHGEDFKDPESGKMYNISGFDPDRAKIDTGVAEEVAMPLVVKPDPFGETPDIRLKLHKIADSRNRRPASRTTGSSVTPIPPSDSPTKLPLPPVGPRTRSRRSALPSSGCR